MLHPQVHWATILLKGFADSICDFLQEVTTLYIYPDNLKARATLWLWDLRDIAIIGIGCLLSVFALAQLGFFVPIVATAVYGFLSIRVDDASILDFIRYAFAFFVLRQQTYEWGMRCGK